MQKGLCGIFCLKEIIEVLELLLCVNFSVITVLLSILFATLSVCE